MLLSYRFAEDGANFSLSSDDPTMTGHYVDGDYRLAQSFGLTDLHLAQSVITSIVLNIETKTSSIILLKT